MLFNSLEYLLFLPLVFLVYWKLCSGTRAQNVWLVAASYFFYGWWDWRFTLLLALTTAASFAAGLWEERFLQQGRERASRRVLWAAVLLNLGILALFKYYDFFAQSLTDLALRMGWGAPSLPLLHVVLPVGISFYTFQALSYTIDVHRRTLRAERDAWAFFAYLSFFPQLVAGPIERATHLLPQMKAVRAFRYGQAVGGLRLILWGLLKKIVIADGCALGVEAIFSDYTHQTGATLVMGALLFSFQIYGDFSGYSDIAVGSARLFGIDLMRNFRTPYFSASVADFWRRWHISLMTWLRDYVYIPLGGNRRGKLRQTANTFIVFGASGLWHGANWTFLVWGLYHACLLVPSIWRGRKGQREASLGLLRRGLSVLRTFLLVMLGWVLFRSETLADALAYLSRIVTDFYLSLPAHGKGMIPLVLLMLGAEAWARGNENPLELLVRRLTPALRMCLYWFLGFALLWYSGAGTQFIYFQF